MLIYPSCVSPFEQREEMPTGLNRYSGTITSTLRTWVVAIIASPGWQAQIVRFLSLRIFKGSPQRGSVGREKATMNSEVDKPSDFSYIVNNKPLHCRRNRFGKSKISRGI